MQLSKVLLLGLSHFSIDVKQTETKVTVVFSPKTTVTDPAVKDLKPLIITFDSPEEMDEKFVEMITAPVEKTVQLFNSVEEYEKNLQAAAKKTKQAEADKKAEAKKPTAAELKKQEEAKKKEELAKATPVLEFEEEKKESFNPLKPDNPTDADIAEALKSEEECTKDAPAVEEAKVVEEEVISQTNSDNDEVVDTTDQEQEEEEESPFAGMPDLFS